MSLLHEVGPLVLGRNEVVIRTNSAEFASVARDVFVDLFSRAGPSVWPGTTTVVFEATEHLEPDLHWSIHRDGEPCELQLRDEAVVVQLQWEFNRLIIESQRAVVHAAAVARSGQAVLLAGQSHSGKTTLAAWLAAHHGLEYLTDEASAIDALAQVRPYPRPLGLRPDSPMARAASGVAQRFMPEEVLVPASVLGGTLARDAARVRLIVFPHFRADSALLVSRVSQADTLERLAHLTPGLVRHGHSVFSRLSGVVLAAPAIDITYPDVAQAANAVVQFFGEQ